jgi:SPX domain-containing protein involved in vacuolar polyphosphate accumulation
MYRDEIKFKISTNMAEVLKQRLSLVMDIDSHSRESDRSYHIRSIYFDNLDSDAFYEKVDGILYRKKYRIRIYNLSSESIKLECKHKHNNKTFKESITISYEMAQKLINNDLDDIIIDDRKQNFYGIDDQRVYLSEDNLLRKFVIEIKLRQLKPSIIVDYRRQAFTYPISDVRVTFDHNVRSGNYSSELFSPHVQTYEMFNKNELVLEVKFNEILPTQIAMILSTIPSYRQAVSKFAICRNIK